MQCGHPEKVIDYKMTKPSFTPFKNETEGEISINVF